MFNYLSKKNNRFLYRICKDKVVRCDYRESFSFDVNDYVKLDSLNYSEYMYLVRNIENKDLTFAFNFNAHFGGKAKDGKVNIEKVTKILNMLNIC